MAAPGLERFVRQIAGAGAALLLTALPLLPAAAATAPAAKPDAGQEIGRRHALVIGNAAYKNISPLKNPVNDSQAICESLKALRFDTICRRDVPDRRSLREAVREMTKKLRPEDVALFYFAGHGVEIDGENYLVPTTADVPARSYVEDEALRLGFVFDELREAKVRLSIIILDACRDNPFGKVRSANSGGLSAPAAVPAGSIIIFPTAPGRVAYDGAGRNGLFTTHLLRHLSSPGITIEEMFKRVIDGVRFDSSRQGQEQVPWMNLSFTGEFCFVGCGTRVSTEQFLALVNEKQQVERMTSELQSQLAERQNEVSEFRRRMSEMEVRLARQQQDSSLSRPQQQALQAQQQEHASQTIRLREQEAELARLNGELEALKRDQVEVQRREAQVIAANQRIDELERQLTQQDERRVKLGNSEIDRLRQERASLLKQREADEALRQELQEARSRLERMQSALATVDRQQRELEAYRVRIARLESDSQNKDKALAAMRNDLVVREQELGAVRERLTQLQDQLRARTQDSKISETVLGKLRQERDALVESSRLLAERDRELNALRQQLVKLESNQAEPARGAVDDLRARLSRYDQQQAELNSYKSRLADAEKRLKDAAANAVRDAAFVAPAL